jgi:putative addiction module CopG family antidote
MKHSVELTLDDKQSAFISEMVKQGRFVEASDVVGAGLKLLERAELSRLARLQAFETEIAAGLESGPSVEWEGMEALIREASQPIAR